MTRSRATPHPAQKRSSAAITCPVGISDTSRSKTRPPLTIVWAAGIGTGRSIGGIGRYRLSDCPARPRLAFSPRIGTTTKQIFHTAWQIRERHRPPFNPAAFIDHCVFQADAATPKRLSAASAGSKGRIWTGGPMPAFADINRRIANHRGPGSDENGQSLLRVAPERTILHQGITGSEQRLRLWAAQAAINQGRLDLAQQIPLADRILADFPSRHICRQEN